ncbi:hypothetical protein DXG01_002773 [Tephrocybe rancida]|nr:hypothetical protein DXG01_002773 [Tephrocybe rancida]
MEDFRVLRVCGKFRLDRKIGSGSFGDVYSSYNIMNSERVAVKMEPSDVSPSRLHHEWLIYTNLQGLGGIPKPVSFGTESGHWAFVMELLGPSLEDLLRMCSHRCPHDDLESLFYVLIYFLCGSLPWQSLNTKTNKARFRRIMEKKISMSTAELCAGLPFEFTRFLGHLRQLADGDIPNYPYLQSLLNNVFIRSEFAHDSQYDWSSQVVTSIGTITAPNTGSTSRTLSQGW